MSGPAAPRDLLGGVEVTTLRVRGAREQRAAQVRRILAGNGKGHMRLTPTQKAALFRRGYGIPASSAS